MERMLVIVFDDEAKAYEGTHALKQLDAEGSISIHAAAVIKKNADGTVTLKEEEEDFPIRTVAGTAIGALIGLLEGPVGLAFGAAAGTLAGSLDDLHVAGVDADFVDEVAATLKAGKCAVIADVSEEWVTPVDARMEPLGGSVFRKATRQVEDEESAKEVAALRAEIDGVKAEMAHARGERRAKLQASLDKLNAKLKAEIDHAKQRTEQVKNESEAKVQALQKKAEKAQGDLKATFNARVKQIRERYKDAQRSLKHMMAGQLKETAARLEK